MNSRSAPPEHSPLAQALKRLETEANFRLALLIAPAGSGKTKALRRWMQQSSHIPIVWVKLDEEDNAGPAFFETLRTAFQSLNDQCIAFVPPPNGKNETINLEEASIEMINALTNVRQDYFLILDDYQVIDNKEIHASVALLIDYQPQKMHLIIASRSEPPLPVPRLRVRRQLIELGPDELRESLVE
jgi:LuxR family transcriptional regulator, maltose regulon positive regulatory protein